MVYFCGCIASCGYGYSRDSLFKTRNSRHISKSSRIPLACRHFWFTRLFLALTLFMPLRLQNSGATVRCESLFHHLARLALAMSTTYGTSDEDAHSLGHVSRPMFAWQPIENIGYMRIPVGHFNLFQSMPRIRYPTNIVERGSFVHLGDYVTPSGFTPPG